MERVVAGLAAGLLVVASLTVGSRGAGMPVATPAPTPEAAASPTEATATPTPLAGPARVVISPTGIPLLVREDRGDRYLVGTPCEATAEVAGTPVGRIDVVLDPGHGGPVDTGAVGANGLKESTLNLQVAAAASQVLADRGIGVLITRNDEYAITLPARIELAEAVDARALISIHHNAPRVNPSPVPGTEVFVQSGAPESIRLGGLLQERSVAALSAFDVPWVSAADAGVLQVRNPEGEDAYGMVRRPPMPAVLLELGYLANPAEADLFATTAYVEAAGLAIADATQAWLESDATGAPLRPAGRIRDPAASAATVNCQDPVLGP